MITIDTNSIYWFIMIHNELIMLSGIVLTLFSLYLFYDNNSNNKFYEKKLDFIRNKTFKIFSMIIGILLILTSIILNPIAANNIQKEVTFEINKTIGLNEPVITLIDKNNSYLTYYGRGKNGDNEIKDFVIHRYQKYLYIYEIGHDALK